MIVRNWLLVKQKFMMMLSFCQEKNLLAKTRIDPSTTFLHLTSTCNNLRSPVICRLEHESNVQQRLLASNAYIYGINDRYACCMQMKLLQVDGQSIQLNES